MKILIPLLLTSLLLAACQKAANGAPADASRLTLTVHTPQTGTRYHRGDTVWMAADVTNPSELHGYSLDLSDSATGASLWNVDAHVHDDHFAIAEHWVDTVSRPATLVWKLTVEMDHDGHTADTAVRLYTQP